MLTLSVRQSLTALQRCGAAEAKTLAKGLDMRRMDCKKLGLALVLTLGIGATGAVGSSAKAQQPTAQLPTYPLKFGAFVARFDPGVTFTMQGQGWPALGGNWKSNGAEL